MNKSKTAMALILLVTLVVLVLGCKQQKEKEPEEGISLLYMINSPNVEFLAEGEYGEQKVGMHFIVPQDQSHVIAFADRPYRLAQKMQGGIKEFTTMYEKSDFMEDPPNVTFSGNNKDNEEEQYSIIEIAQPFTFQTDSEKDLVVIIPVQEAIGSETIPPFGSYKDCSMVVDVLGIGDVLEIGSAALPLLIDMFEGLVQSQWNSVNVRFSNETSTTLNGLSYLVSGNTQPVFEAPNEPVKLFSKIEVKSDSVLVFDLEYGSNAGFLMASPQPVVIEGKNMALVVYFAVGYYVAYGNTVGTPWSQNVAMDIQAVSWDTWQSYKNEKHKSLLANWFNALDPPRLWGWNSVTGGANPHAVADSVEQYTGHAGLKSFQQDGEEGEKLDNQIGIATFLIEENSSAKLTAR